MEHAFDSRSGSLPVPRSPHTSRTHVQQQHDMGLGASSSHSDESRSLLFSLPWAQAECYRATASVENSTLTAPSSPRRPPSRLHKLRPPQSSVPPPPSAIQALSGHIHQNSSQDVLPAPVSENFRSSSSTVKPLPYGALPPNFLESLGLSSFSVPHHGHVANPSSRLRTYNQVFHSPSDLAAHHGIPQSLPPPPRTTPRRLSDTPADPSPFADLNFANLCSNYLSMLSPKNADQLPSSADPKVSNPLAPPPPTMQDEAAAQAIIDALQASPAFSGGGFDMMSDFLTSPLESPLDDDMLTTPALGSADMMDSPDIFTSPVIPGFPGGGFDDLPSLFPDMQGYESLESKPRQPHFHPPPVNTSPDFSNMYRMPSPDTPSMDPSSLHTSPAGLNDRPSASRRKSQPTGTRKNVTPETLVPLDAPIQNRKYVTPSQTSRKELPVTFARKRARSAAFEEDDTLAADDGGSSSVTPTEEEAIKAKRLQNTLAARRSRKRKLEYQRELEDSLEAERQEKEMWKARALVLEALLRDKGHDVPRIDDA